MKNVDNFHINEFGIENFYINILNLVFKECPEGIIYKDKNLKYLAVNPAYCKMFKLPNAIDFLGCEKAAFLSEENYKIINEVDLAVKMEMKPISYVININESIYNITSSPIINNKEFLGLVTIIKDITHEESIKEKFVLKHFQLKSLLENIPMLIYMQDTNQKYIAGTKPSQKFVKDGYDEFSNIHINRTKIKLEEEEENNFVLNSNQILVK